jgi:HD superfamily phosphohydrolase
MADFNVRRISDPVHNAIGLSEVEAAIIASRAFQRLRNVKQLGLANLVFPGADYSRLSHCVGVCHVTGRILSALAANTDTARAPFKPDAKKIQAYRLAGLLHDIGHYPFSHAMEDAIQNYGTKSLLKPDGAVVKTLGHETVGKVILETDPEIPDILRKYGVDPAAVSAIFNRTQPENLTNLISSDLDADRIDYLLRTAHFSGLPYGNIDLDYLLTQLRLDDKGRVCLTPKAVCAADHFLLSRYFDYQQVSFHKTVAALEKLLKDVLNIVIDAGMIDSSEEGIRSAIAKGDWAEFDDLHVWGLIRQLAKENSINGFKARSLLDRKVPKQVFHLEDLAGIDRQADFTRLHKFVEGAKHKAAAHFGIDPSLWYVWYKDGITLTKVGSRIPVGAIETGADAKRKDKYEQSIRIVDQNGGESTDIMSVSRSLMNILSNSALFALRLYVLLPDDKKDSADAISSYLQDAL